MKKKILLVDTNYATIPVYEYLLNKNFEVYVIGRDPAEPLAKISANYIKADYSNIKNLQSIIDKYNFEHVVPGCTDLSYQVCSKLSSACISGVDAQTTTNTINNKFEFRKLCMELEIGTPKLLNGRNCAYEKQLIVKPVDSFSGKGITKLMVPNQALLRDAIDYAVSQSASGDYIVEEYVSGELYSYSAFISNNVVFSDFVVREASSVNPYVVDTSYVTTDFDNELRAKLKTDIEKLAISLNLKDGLVHAQFIFNDSGYFIIEMTRRCPGDLYAKLIEESTCIPYAKLYADPFVKIPYDYNLKSVERNYIIRHTLTVEKPTMLHSVCFEKDINIKHYYQLGLVGDYLHPSPISRVGLMLCDFKTEKEMMRGFKDFVNRSVYSIR